MREMFILTAHLLVTLAKLARPGDFRVVAAESLAVKHHLLIMKRSRQRAPNLTVKAAQKVHQWPQGNYISLRSGGNGGLASGRGSARGDSLWLLKTSSARTETPRVVRAA